MWDTNKQPYDFWEDLYKLKDEKSSGVPSLVLQKYTKDRVLGRALDLGCAKGDDAVWLAKLGWQVLAIDISDTALMYARLNASKNGVLGQIEFEQHDLSNSIPNGSFDLVSAMFLQTPLKFQRARILKHASSKMNKGGLFLSVTHQSVAPWSKVTSTKVFMTAQERLQELDLDMHKWKEIYVGPFERVGTGPNGATADMTDAIVALERI